ncbi:hypothetical protein NDU88_000898 [Pleurodeles waltl]|uniref:Uncharacterized protein n=1 Tax=Pleurodeles waltl TaxID=8319 RepID=A0AAV7R854_PLEWA|nr:hypothetical protein NDU88_000898 [Pleurodeles waltl]
MIGRALGELRARPERCRYDGAHSWGRESLGAGPNHNCAGRLRAGGPDRAPLVTLASAGEDVTRSAFAPPFGCRRCCGGRLEVGTDGADGRGGRGGWSRGPDHSPSEAATRGRRPEA